jgi:hypothetical protein
MDLAQAHKRRRGRSKSLRAVYSLFDVRNDAEDRGRAQLFGVRVG